MSGFHPYKIGEPSVSGIASAASDDGTPGAVVAVSKTHVKATKRIRGEIACAECRRLKIRCDRMVPCSTCLKRGCSSLCPNGTVPPGEGSRFVLAATEHLQGTLQRLEARMHSLEDALSIAHATHSPHQHPLLDKFKAEDNDDECGVIQTTTDPPEQEEPAKLPESLSVLHVHENGGAYFFGPSGSSEVLLHSVPSTYYPQTHPIQPSPLPELDTSYLPPEIIMYCQSFPFTPHQLPVQSVQSSIESFLPSLERAFELLDTMLEHLSWMFHIVSRHDMQTLISLIYQHHDLEYGPHDLALLFTVFSVGAMVDLNLPPYNTEAQHYHMLAKAALALQPVLLEESFVSVKVLHLMSIYNGLSGKEENLETSYALMSLASQVALRIGCHVDPTMWGFTGKEAYDRRVYFWNLVAGSLWQSLVTGRPPIILATFIDCKIPTPEEENAFQQGEVPLGFGIWGFRASDLLLQVVRATLSAKPPTYTRVLELDKMVRDFEIANPINPAVEDTTALSMRNFVRSHYKDLILMFLHRAFFTQAMTEYPADPMSSPHAKSVAAAYHSACVILDDTRVQYLKKPALVVRVWRIWTLAFSAAVVVGTVAARGGHLSLQPPALEQFESACTVFRGAAQTSARAARALLVLEAMLQKARAMTLVAIPEPLTPTINMNLLPYAVRGYEQPPLKQMGHHPPQYHGHYSHPPPPTQYSTFAGLAQGWDGMFHETPSSGGGGMGAEMMLDDRWLYFMNNYDVL